MTNDILINAFNLKPAEAIKFLREKGFAISWNWYEVWQEAHTKAFTVAKATTLDVLQDIRDMVDNALNEGITFQQFQKELKPRLQAKGWWGKVPAGEIPGAPEGADGDVQLGSPRRLRTIYQTNLQTAYMAGREKGQLAVAQSRPYWQYIAVMDSRTRPAHRALHGKVFRYDDPIWKKIYPPNGWGCRCRVRTLSETELQREGATVESSEGRLLEKQVPIGKPEDGKLATVTGIKLTDANGQPVVFWTDPGWDYNPGAKRKQDLSGYDKDLRSEFKKALKKGSS